MDISIEEYVPKEAAREEDASAISELITELRQEYTPVSNQGLQRTVDSCDTLFVARAAGKIIGITALYLLTAPHKKYAHLELVVVHPDYRRNGVGRALVTEAITLARACGAAEIQLTSNHVNPRRVGAIALYKSLGFVEPATTLLRLDL